MGVRAENRWTSHFPAHAKRDSMIAVLQSLVAIKQSNGALVPPESAHHSYIALAPISVSSRCPDLAAQVLSAGEGVLLLETFCLAELTKMLHASRYVKNTQIL